LPDYKLALLFHPLDFTQINLEMNRMMLNQAMNFLLPQPDETVLDLFCGIGNFTLPIARHAKRVVGIEGSLEMVERARENSNYNDINNVDFYAANLEALATSTNTAPWLDQQYDKILLDPPRVGAKAILPYFKQFAAKQIVYISCNPATLARDAGELVHQYGYKLSAVGVMNMFPHTAHIEAMAIFHKN
jgi:23S rRNA (uracil1939-C5)-methyltransferase